jgi:drug/metabolite transporter (DMT)-like permease
MIYVPLAMSTLGHAAWDNVLHWMITNDPDTSILHMHWVRLVFVWLFLAGLSRKQTPALRTWDWWLVFALWGWVVPSISYTLCVKMTGYRIAISLQPFIPLFVALQTGKDISGRRLLGLICAMMGTLCIWCVSPWYHKDYELWQIWGSLFFASVYVLCMSKWFVMLNDVKERQLATITKGVGVSIIVMFCTMIVWTPQHLQAAFMYRWDRWIIVIITAAITAACKNWVVAYCSTIMEMDSVAIFECLHPIATLCVDISRGSDLFEYEDIVSILLMALGWILYPKTII